MSVNGPVWVVKANDLQLMIDAGLPDTLAGQEFTASTFWNGYGITSQEEAVSPDLDGIQSRIYTSYKALERDFDSGFLPGHYQAIIFDLEGWSYTPQYEQQHPGYYEKLAAELAHAHNMTIINTPARDLAKAVGATDYDAWYLDTDQAGMAAKYADAIVIQSQADERDLKVYQRFVSKAVTQAEAANPDATLMAGLSTTSRCQVYGPCTADQLYAAYQSIYPSIVSGFWLNVPINKWGSGCCPRGCPRAAIRFLAKIYG
jgi:hypothetical protein